MARSNEAMSGGEILEREPLARVDRPRIPRGALWAIVLAGAGVPPLDQGPIGVPGVTA